MTFGPLSWLAWMVAVGTAWTLRNKSFAIFVAVLVGLEALVATALFPHTGRLWPVFVAFHVTVFVQVLSLSRPRLRPFLFRVLISWPAYFFLAATLLGFFVMPLAAYYDAPAPAWAQALMALPFGLSVIGMWQSLRGRESEVDVSLLDVERGPQGPQGPQETPPESERHPVTRHPSPTLPDAARDPSGDASGANASGAQVAATHRTLRVVQITDPHLGPFMSVSRLRRIAERAVARDPDLVILTGDFLTMESQAKAAYLGDALMPLKALPGRVFACLGNHDHEALHIVQRGLAMAGVTLLVDESLSVDTRAGRVQIVGADYRFQGRKEQLQRVVQRNPREPGALRLWLLHDPGAFRRIPEGEADIVFSGHTHGGQVGLLSLGGTWTPVWSIAKMPDHGLFARGRDRLYVHRGTGHYGFPLRLGVPSEQSLVRVHFHIPEPPAAEPAAL